MNLNEMLDTKYLQGSQFADAPQVVTIQGFKKTNMAKDGEEPKYRWLLKFKELEKPMVCNKTNLQRLAKIFASENTDNWISKPVELFFDENVEFGGKIVGGLRVRKANGAKIQPAGESVGDLSDDIPW